MTPDVVFPALGGSLFLGLIVLVAWSIAWKGYALWIAAKNSHRWWFVALLIINTAGILDIIYLFAVGRPSLKKSGVLQSSTPVQ